MVSLLVFEGLGTPELLVIIVAALILFGPRKLPQLSRSLGKSLAEFRRASEDFKRTWEREVAMENAEHEARSERALLPEDNSILNPSVERSQAVHAAAAETEAANHDASSALASSDTMAANPSVNQPVPVTTAPADVHAAEPTSKRDWL